MLHSRRKFLAAGAATMATAPLTAFASESAPEDYTSPEAILSAFKSLPGEVAVKIHPPAVDDEQEFLVESNPSKQLFVGSAIKTFIQRMEPR